MAVIVRSCTDAEHTLILGVGPLRAAIAVCGGEGDPAREVPDGHLRCDQRQGMYERPIENAGLFRQNDFAWWAVTTDVLSFARR